MVIVVVVVVVVVVEVSRVGDNIFIGGAARTLTALPSQLLHFHY